MSISNHRISVNCRLGLHKEVVAHRSQTVATPPSSERTHCTGKWTILMLQHQMLHFVSTPKRTNDYPWENREHIDYKAARSAGSKDSVSTHAIDNVLGGMDVRATHQGSMCA